eukprot:Hpha_TRINITY_DN5174_c0_g1::TRINITY_DN5174_c0_g1_i1::g.193023::m.193023
MRFWTFHLKRGREKIPVRRLSMMLYGTAHFTEGVQELREEVCRRLRGRPPSEWLLREIAQAVYGLRSASQVDDVLSTLAPALALAEPGKSLSNLALCEAIQGLGAHPTLTTGRKALLGAILRRLDPSESSDGSTLSTVLSSLPGFRNDDPSARAILSWTLRQARGLTKLTTDQLGSMLYGLRRLSGFHEAEKLLTVLEPWVQRCEGAMGEKMLGQALYGLRSYPKVAPVIVRALNDRMGEFSGALTNTGLATMLFGMSSHVNSGGARQFLHHVSHLVRTRFDSKMQGQDVAMSLYGLKQMTESPETREFLFSLVPLIQLCPESTMNLVSFCGAVFGLCSQGTGNGAAAALEELSRFLPALADRAIDEWAVAALIAGMGGMNPSPTVSSFIRFANDRLSKMNEITDSTAFQTSLRFGLVLRRNGVEEADTLVRILLSRKIPNAGNLLQRQGTLQVLNLSASEGAEFEFAKVEERELKSDLPATVAERALRVLFERSGVRGALFNVMHSSGFEIDVLVGNKGVELTGRAAHYTSPARQELLSMRVEALARCGVTLKLVDITLPLVPLVEKLISALAPDPPDPDPASRKQWRALRQNACWGWAHATEMGAASGLQIRPE